LSRRSAVRKGRSVVPALMEARLLAFAAILFLAPLAIHGGEDRKSVV
jgi:hypothetical protein